MSAAVGLFGASRLKRVLRTKDVGHDEVARVAYELYERRGRADGHALEDWLKAERLARQRKRQASQIIV